MAGKIDLISPVVTPSPPSSCSPRSGFVWPSSWDRPLLHGQFLRSTSDQHGTPVSRRQGDSQFTHKWHTALRCKQNVGTKEWVNCKKGPCVELRGELNHLLECRYLHIGGCKERCTHLRVELQKFRELSPKYPTVADEQQQFSDEMQARLQTLKIREFVTESCYSPSSPNVEEPFQSLVKNRQRNQNEQCSVSVEVLIPLDEDKLSVTNGNFRKGLEWSKICFLGNGTFGSTYLCFDCLRRSHFAIKKLPTSNFQDDEIEIWQKINGKHGNILNLYGAIRRKEKVLIFMEYMEGGSVANYLAENGPLRESIALRILQQVLSGLAFMHRLHVIHGDIKAANILMDSLCLNIKLADFGSSVDLHSVESGGPSRLRGTLAFMAPEVCRSEAPLPSSDIWSAMCLLIQLLSAEAPWEEYRHQGDGLLFVIGSAKRPPTLPQCTVPVQEIFAQGLNVTASSRPTAVQLLRHRVFDFSEEDEEDVDSDDSTEYYSSLSDLESSGEYFSSEEIDGQYPPNPDDNPSKKEKTTNSKDPNCKAKHIDSKGGKLQITSANIKIPSKALSKDTVISIKRLDPSHYYQTIIDHNIQDKVTILGDIYKLRPSGLKFHEDVRVKITLPEALHQSEDVTVFHGSFDKKTNKLIWEEIEKELLPFPNSTVATVNINHFSALAFVKTLPSFAYEYVKTYLNYKAVLYRFVVLVSRKSEDERLRIHVVMIQDSFYLNTSKELFRDHYICHKMKEDDFCEMYGSRREYCCQKENIQVSIEGVMGDRKCPPKRHTVQNLFGGEEVASWELDTSHDDSFGGTVLIERDAGQKYRFQFWEHEPTRYVRNVLQLGILQHANMLPIARALNLNQEEVKDLVESTGGDEDKQLKQITETWGKKAENNELPRLRDFVASVSQQAILVSNRGELHLNHLLEFSQNWSEQLNKEALSQDLYFQKMAKNGESLCQSVFSDCLLQLDHSDVHFVSSRENLEMDSKVMKKILEKVKQDYPLAVVEKLNALVQAFESYEEDRSITLQCERFCQKLFDWIPWLMQVVKDCFKIHPVTKPTGLWGLQCEVDPSMANQEMRCFDMLRKIAEVLKSLCTINENTDRRNDDELNNWCRTLNIEALLERFSVAHKEWQYLVARIRYHHRYIGLSNENDQDRIYRQDLENLLCYFRQYVTFCPTRLVQFSFSCENVRKEPLSFDESARSFTQKCDVSSSTGADTLLLRIKVDVCIKGNCLVAEVDVAWQRCEERDHSNGCCTMLIIVYEHHESNESGTLKIVNECENLSQEHPVTIQAESDQTDGFQTSDVLIKEGCPSEKELNTMARSVTNEWKQLGRLLLRNNNAVDIIDQDKNEVVEKTIAMFERWTQQNASNATYKQLYDALVDETVSRADMAQKYCVVAP